MDISTDTCPIANLRLEKNLNKYAVSVRVGEYYEFDYSKISNQMHHHDCFELVIVLDGKGVFLYEDEEHRLKGGDLFLSEPGKDHEIHIGRNDTMTLFYILFEISVKKNGTSVSYEERLLDQFLEQHKNTVADQRQLFGYFLFFEEYAGNKGDCSSFWYIKAVENFLFHCLEIFCGQTSNKHEYLAGDLFEKALDYIDKNLAGKISADSISESINTSKRNLYRLFNKNMNRSVNDYVNERKMHLAGTYLKMNLRVTESASLVGIENLSQFNKLFRRYLNTSPSEFKKRYSGNAGGYGRRKTE